LGVALVSFVDTTITGRAFAYRGGYHLDPNQELISLGLCNIGTGFFQGFAVGSSHSRTALNDMYGGRTQLAQLLAAILLAVFLLHFTFIVKNVPEVGLAGIIIVAGFHLLRPLEVATMWRTWRPSGYISIGTTCAVLIAGLPIGILVSVALAFILVLHRLARPYETIKRPSELPEAIVFRFAGPLYFFNIGHFADRVHEEIESASEPVKILLINAEAVTDTDLDAVETLQELQASLKRHGIVMGMFEVKGHFKEMLEDTRLPKPIDFAIYPSMDEAVKELSKGKDKDR
jgi:SulP family sulfate permease